MAQRAPRTRQIQWLMASLIAVVAVAAAGLMAAIGHDHPTPPPDLGQGAPTARATRNGLTVELWLASPTAAIGQRLFALARVSNMGDPMVTFETNTCGTGPARVAIDRSGAADGGVAWTGNAAAFKRQLLKAEGEGWGGFTDAARMDEGVSCPAFSRPGQFVPGQVEELVVAWDALGGRGQHITPGPATVRATFTSWRTGTDGPPEGPTQALTAQASIELTGQAGAERALAPYIDAALDDPGFADWLAAQPIDTWINPSFTFWPNSEGQFPAQPRYANAPHGAVDISLFVIGRPEAPDEGRGMVTLDADSLRVMGVELPS